MHCDVFVAFYYFILWQSVAIFYMFSLYFSIEVLFKNEIGSNGEKWLFRNSLTLISGFTEYLLRKKSKHFTQKEGGLFQSWNMVFISVIKWFGITFNIFSTTLLYFFHHAMLFKKAEKRTLERLAKCLCQLYFCMIL